ncbi:Bifunctional purine biosynthesis protein PurH [Coemansia aciculifera]|uniref:Bifunctional purine biosynthesis protein PurH n=1 Tax=Coemansia aciculifera TaxID=417176 RepID=A0A9W8IL14_9FUNG|nr:Bifunctional purine biosynthesis protein PurH [Coemansia aciculifera]KAJ2874769.1 Bifunctional purine biosynthesis protein PurH [Coemansia aciculifera]
MLPRYGKAHTRCSGAKTRSAAAGNSSGLSVPRVFAVDLHEVDSDKFQDSRDSGFSMYVLTTVLLVSLSAMCIGWSLGIAGASKLTICLFQDEDTSSGVGEFPKHILFSENSWSVAIGILSVGGLVGALASGVIADSIGRRNTLVINNGFFLAGSVWMGTATTAVHFSLGRFVMGIGCGVASNIANTYVGEISPIGWRGFYGAFFHFALMLGILGTQVAAALVNHMQWRVVVAIPGVLSLMQIAMLPLRVESPSYLIKARHVNEARHALLKLRSGFDVTAEWQECLASLDSSAYNATMATDVPPAIGASSSSSSGSPGKFTHPRIGCLSQLDASTEDASDSETTVKSSAAMKPAAATDGRTCKPGVWQMICGRTRDDLRHLVVCNMAVMCLQQLCGVYVVLFSDCSLASMLFDPESPLPTRWACIIACIAAIPAGVLCMFKVDTLGRRPLLLISLGGMCACSVLISVGLFYGPSALVMTAMFLCCFVFNMGVGAIPWFYISESTPAYARSAMTMLGCSVYWCLSIIIGLIVPAIERSSSSQWLFVVYGSISALGFLFVAMFVPETATRATADIVKEHSGSMHFVIKRRLRGSSQFFIGDRR